jgi:glucose-6-phosphate 1-epimerase
LWLSPKSNFIEGKAIRGGIPVCFPWFSNHPFDTVKPKHGFVRTKYWKVSSSETLIDGQTKIFLSLSDDDSSRAFWPHSFDLTLAITVGRYLSVEFNVKNTGSTSFSFTEALHTYFAIGNIERISLNGLHNAEYFDKTNTVMKQIQKGNLDINEEVNRIYSCDHDVVISDYSLNRKIRIHKEGSNTTVVWNPWHKAASVMDLDADSYRNFICVEVGNCENSLVELSPRSEHLCASIISIE